MLLAYLLFKVKILCLLFVDEDTEFAHGFIVFELYAQVLLFHENNPSVYLDLGTLFDELFEVIVFCVYFNSVGLHFLIYCYLKLHP